jgi:hypothetical protein
MAKPAASPPSPKLSELLRAFVEANPSQLEKGETVEEWVSSMYLQKNTVAKLKRIAIELLGQFEGDPSPAAADIRDLLRPLTE